MKVCVISLTRTPERLAEFHRRNASAVPYKVVAAVDGRSCVQEEIIKAGYFDGTATFTPGAIGCALSHIHLWESIAQGDEAVTICEDDALFHGQFADCSKRMLASLDGAWDFVAWGWNFNSILLAEIRPNLGRCLFAFDQREMRTHASEYLREPVNPNLFKLLQCFGTIGYAISPAGARKLLARVLPIRGMDLFVRGINRTLPNTGLDIALNHFYPELECFVAFPPLVLTLNERAHSTVQAKGGNGDSP